MSVTIDSLDIQIRSSAGSAAANIDRLADALGRMRDNAKLTTVTNNLNKLSDALGRLQSTSAGLSNIHGLADAMNSLSQVQKGSGFNSLVNTLKKLPDIVNQLDAGTLATFSARMRQLAAALAPLATEINKVSTAFTKLPARVSQIVTGTNRLASASRAAADAQEDHNDSINAMSLNLATGIANLQSFIGVLHQVRDALVAAISTAIEWDGIQFRFGQAFGEDAQEVYDWILQINDALGISVQEFMQNSGLYASLLKGFGVENEKVTEIAVGLTELTYDIWAFNNDRYKQLEEAAEAVRSAITGEIEPIRNAGIALTEASMQEYLDSIGMAHVSMEKLTEAQKAEVRYAVMVNSAMNQGIVGTYAREMDTAEGSVRRLTQQIKTLVQAFGSLFIPILQKVIPWITAFVSILTDAVHWVAALFGIQITAIDWSKTTSGVGDLASGAEEANTALGGAADAAKKLKTYTMGFDELNVIDPPSDSGGGGGGGAGGAGGNGFPGLDLESLWDQALLDSASKKVDEIKQKILDFFEKWKTQIQIIAAALATLGLSKMLGHLGQAFGLGEKFLGVMKTIGKLASTAIIITIQYSLVKELLGNFMATGEWKNLLLAGIVSAIGTGILYSMWGPAGIVIGLGVTAAASLSAIIENGGINSVESATVAIGGLASAIGAVAIAWKKLGLGALVKNIGAFFSLLKEGNSLISVLAAAFPKLANAIGAVAGKFGSIIGNFGAFFALLKEGNSLGSVLAATFPKLATAFTTIGTAISGAVTAIAGVLGISVGWVVVIIAAVVAAIAAVIVFWDEIKLFFTETLPEWVSIACEAIGNFFSNLWEDIKAIWATVAEWFDTEVIQPLVDFFAPIVDWISEFFRGCWMIIRAVWQVASEWFNTVVIQPIVNFFKNAWQNIKDTCLALWTGIKGIWQIAYPWFKETVIQPVVNFFKNAWQEIKDTCSALWSGITQIWGLASPWFDEKVVQPLVTFFSKAWEKIRSAFEKAFNGISSFATWILNGVITLVENSINSVIGKINSLLDAFNSAVEWAAGILGEDWEGIKLIEEVNLKRYASGGFVDQGELFIAREAGPEMVGRIGSHNAVANNGQIVDGIAAGVYSAVVAAMSATGGRQDQNINVYLDGKQIYASVKKTESERGRTLLGSQLGYV